MTPSTINNRVNPERLFRPFRLRDLQLANRIVMAPMTRSKSPGGIPGPDVAAYYRRRAEGGVGLLITEGTFIPEPTAGHDPAVPRFYGEHSLQGWKRVVEEVHQAGGRIFPQLWHIGSHYTGENALTPSGLHKPGEAKSEPATEARIREAILAFGEAAFSAKQLGFDGVELHGAHGYLIDQFFWEGTNQRTDSYGGDLVKRTRFAVEAIREVRRRFGANFPVVLRFSQWKLQDFEAKLARTPQELEAFLQPLADAGVDIFHCSTRRFWDAEFPGSNLNLAGWTKKLTGKPTISVGSVTLNKDMMSTFGSPDPASVTGLDELLERMAREEFDLVALGRALIVNPNWPQLVGQGRLGELQAFDRAALQSLL